MPPAEAHWTEGTKLINDYSFAEAIGLSTTLGQEGAGQAELGARRPHRERVEHARGDARGARGRAGRERNHQLLRLGGQSEEETSRTRGGSGGPRPIGRPR